MSGPIETRQAVWRQLEALAEGYQQANGVRPNRLSLGARAVEWLEPREPGDAHPRHLLWWSPTPGVWVVWQPAEPPLLPALGWVKGMEAKRACRQAGGHWWHPVHGAMIDWFCCRCGKVTDGLPRDGTSGW